MSCSCKKAVNIFESSSTPYRIGKTGENVYQEIEFNFSKWLSEYPDAKIDLLIRVPKNGFYLLAEGITESTYLWKPSAFDLANPGRAAVMARMSSGEVRAKSDPIPFEIVRSMDYNLDISEPGPTRPSLMDEWIKDIYEAAARYPKIGEDDYWYVWDVVEGDWVKTDTYAGGTEGKGGIVYVTIDKNSKATMSASEILAAINSGKFPIMDMLGVYVPYAATNDQRKPVFSVTAPADDNTGIQTMTVTVYEDRTWTWEFTDSPTKSEAVLYTPQSPTTAQMEQARDNIGAVSSDSFSELDAIVTGRTKSVFSEEVESQSSSYVYGKVNYSANAGEKITVNISGTAFTGTKTTLYFFYGDSAAHTSVGLVALNTDLEFVLPDSITAIDTYRANEAQPGTVIFTVTKVSSSGGIVENVQELNAEVSDIQDAIGDNAIYVEKDHTSGSLNIEIPFSANAGDKVCVKPYGTAYAAPFCNVYARYVGESSNTNLGRAYIGQDNIFELTEDTEKLYVYTMNTQSGTASADIRKLGLKDSVADLLAAVNPIKGKKLNFLGDSITYGGGAATRFTDVLASMLDCTCRNYGITGSTITYDENRNPMCVRYADMDDDADIVAVMGGTNDYWNNKPLGKMGDTVNTTFYGALDIMIRGLVAKYPSALFYMVTPPHGDNGGNFDGSTKSNSGSMQDIANAICEVASKYSIPVLDVFNAGGLYPSVSAQKEIYYSDGVHLNTEGQKKLAEMHASFILSGGLLSGKSNDAKEPYYLTVTDNDGIITVDKTPAEIDALSAAGYDVHLRLSMAFAQLTAIGDMRYFATLGISAFYGLVWFGNAPLIATARVTEQKLVHYELTSVATEGDVQRLESALIDKANASDVYTKTEINQKLVGVMVYKGTKETIADLPSSENETGDVWHVNANGAEYGWNGTEWEELGTEIDFSVFAKKTWVTGQGYQTASDVQTAIAGVRQLPTVTASDNGKVLGVVNGEWAVKSDEGGMSEAFKQALLDCFEHVAWIDADGQDYYDALYAALYPPKTLVSISAAFNQGTAVIYDTDNLDTLKQYLTVTATYDDTSTGVITNYTLSGTLTEGTSTITVLYNGKTTTFNVTVTALSYVTNGLIGHWDGINNTGNGHDSAATKWTDLVGGREFVAFNSDSPYWSFGTDHMLFNPASMGSYAVPRNVLKCANFGQSKTIEVVFQTSVTDKSQIVAILTGDNSGSSEPRNQHLVALYQSTQTVIVKGGDQNGCKAVDSLLNVHSVSATYGDTVAEYINGAIAETNGTVDYFTSVDYTSLLIGGGTSWAFKGKIYSIRIYDRVLSASEIAANHAVDVARFGLE